MTARRWLNRASLWHRLELAATYAVVYRAFIEPGLSGWPVYACSAAPYSPTTGESYRPVGVPPMNQVLNS
jgi:hypothetical protein